jgi:hypothetical protein
MDLDLLDDLGWSREAFEKAEQAAGRYPSDDDEYEDDGGERPDFTVGDLVELCLLPTLRDASVQFAVLLLWCVVFRGLVSLRELLLYSLFFFKPFQISLELKSRFSSQLCSLLLCGVESWQRAML